MTRACGPPETLREKKGLKQNSNGKPNNWGTNLSQSNPRLHDHSARGVPWKQRPAYAGPNGRGTGHTVAPSPPRSIILRLAEGGGSRPDCQWCCGSPIGSEVPSSVPQTLVTIGGSAAG